MMSGDDDPFDEWELTERLVTPAEMAGIMGVEEPDVRAWIAAGELDAELGDDGQPRLRVRERRPGGDEDPKRGASIQGGFTCYNGPRDRSLLADARAEQRARAREAELTAAEATGVDVDALTAALAERLAAVAPPQVRIASDAHGTVRVHDVRGGSAGVAVDAALTVATAGDWENRRPPAERVRDAADICLDQAQDYIAEVTTDPWPNAGPGGLPVARALLSDDGTRLRLLYGDPAEPVLELAPLALAEVV